MWWLLNTWPHHAQSNAISHTTICSLTSDCYARGCEYYLAVLLQVLQVLQVLQLAGHLVAAEYLAAPRTIKCNHRQRHQHSNPQARVTVRAHLGIATTSNRHRQHRHIEPPAGSTAAAKQNHTHTAHLAARKSRLPLSILGWPVPVGCRRWAQSGGPLMQAAACIKSG